MLLFFALTAWIFGVVFDAILPKQGIYCHLGHLCEMLCCPYVLLPPAVGLSMLITSGVGCLCCALRCITATVFIAHRLYYLTMAISLHLLIFRFDQFQMEREILWCIDGHAVTLNGFLIGCIMVAWACYRFMTAKWKDEYESCTILSYTLEGEQWVWLTVSQLKDWCLLLSAIVHHLRSESCITCSWAIVTLSLDVIVMFAILCRPLQVPAKRSCEDRRSWRRIMKYTVLKDIMVFFLQVLMIRRSWAKGYDAHEYEFISCLNRAINVAIRLKKLMLEPRPVEPADATIRITP